jgi:hypothetical protein
MRVCLYEGMRVCARQCIPMYACVRVYPCLRGRMYACMCVLKVWFDARVRVYACLRVVVSAYPRMCVRLYMCMRVRACA